MPVTKYSRDEWVLLYKYYVDHDTSEHTDSHPNLIKFAGELGRFPSSVDLSLRNIHAYVEGPGMPHSSSIMKDVVDAYRQNKIAS